MAKKKKDRARSSAPANEGAPAPKGRDGEDKPSPALAESDAAFLRGDYAELARLAHDTSVDEKVRTHAAALAERAKTDPVTWALGVGASLLAIIVGALTLGG